MIVTTSEIESASEKLKTVVVRTPLQYSKRLSNKYSSNVYIKREDLQEVRSFKIRGAYNKMSSLTDEEKKRGIVTASAGNHAQGVAYSCSAMKTKGYIYMPAITPNQKVEKVRHFGGKYVEVVLTGQTFDEASAAAQKFCKEKNLIYVHPFNDKFTITGQGTIGKEIYEDLEGKIDFVVAPIGGGGLISGISSYIKEKNKSIKVIGCEPNGAAEMSESIKQNKIITLESIDTFVDGCAVKTAGDITFDICRENVDAFHRIPEGKVCSTMIELYQNEGIIAEPSGALSISTLDEIKDQIKGKTVVCILSGGNNDILRYPEIMERSLVYKGLKHYFLIEFAQKPGQLKRFVNEVMGPDDDIVLFEYIKKNNKERGPALVGIELKSRYDFEPFLERMKSIELSYTILKSDNILYKYLI